MNSNQLPSLIPNHICALAIVLFAFMIQFVPLHSQELPAYNPILTDMGELESRRDAKCHATASRLEDFIYGTPLSFPARKTRIDFQQALVENIWIQYTARWQSNARQHDLNIFKEVVGDYLRFQEVSDGQQVSLPGGKEIVISARDFRQYSSIAYAYRAILAVQQSCTLSATELAPLEGEILDYFKQSIDIAVLGLLSQADQLARQDNSPQIKEEHMTAATADWQLDASDINTAAPQTSIPPANFIYPVIQQKLTAYQAYNSINQAVFLRNIQVYFTKVPWPKDQTKSDGLKNHFNELMVAFTGEVLMLAQEKARAAANNGIRYEHMYEAVQDYLPHSVNPFEDVLYFPRLHEEGGVSIQAYDLDAFRDSGLHWQYLKFALDDYYTKLALTPDPFALEMLVEGVAQFAVLIFRIAGTKAIALQDSRLNIDHINLALRDFQERLQRYDELPPPSAEENQLFSAQDYPEHQVGDLFQDRTREMGIEFQHRNSDWLSRLIRGYLIKEEEQETVVQFSIPPAFGGGGVAAEDIDGDGWVDVLLLGGKGCELYKNQEGQGFVSMTERSGINWQRADGTSPEARQPLVADFDNDGDQDIIIIYANDDHRVFENRGNFRFRDQTEQAQLGGAGLIGGPTTVIDYDRDGLLDIYIGYFGNYLQGELPTLRRHNTNGSPNKLFRNQGNFRFADVSAGSGVENTGWTQAVGHTDLNGDGWQDLIAGNDFGTNSYYLNNHDGTFTDVSGEIGTDKPSYTMNVGIGDINGDLAPDFYISNIVVMEKDDKYVLPNEDTRAHFDAKSLASMRVVEANDLFVSQSRQAGNPPLFQQSTNIGRGYSATGWSWDADFFDYDNDTDLDLYCLTGMNQYSVYSAENPYYTSPDGKVLDITLAQSQAEKNILFENREGRLNVVEAKSGLDYEGTSRSAAYFDYDQDGDLDIIVNEFQAGARLFENTLKAGAYNWLKVKLRGNVDRSNRDAVGAQLILRLPNDQRLWREIHSTDGYLSVHPKTAHFGVGQATTVDLEIIWPDGTREEHKDLESNKLHSFNQN